MKQLFVNDNVCDARNIMKIVGVTGGYRVTGTSDKEFYLDSEYFDAVEAAGAAPMLLAPALDESAAMSQVARVDALIISGGADVPPERYGHVSHTATQPVHQRRDSHDFACLDAALRLKIPILAICYGMQLLNVALGGTLIQDLPEDGEQHRRDGIRSVHDITIGRDTRLRDILGSERLTVNSSHHQAVDTLGKGLHVSARSIGGVVEAIELPLGPLVLGVQWHPEALTDVPEQLALFKALLK